MEDIRKEYKCIRNAGVARRLHSKMGVPVFDFKPDRNNHDKTVFVFKRTPEFEEAFAQINKEIAESKKEATAE